LGLARRGVNLSYYRSDKQPCLSLAGD